MFVIVLQRLLTEALLDIFYFPIWWFTVGVKRSFLWCFAIFKSGNDELAPGLWIANIFVPMFGQYDWQGRIISFFMRTAQIIGRLIALAVWLIFCLVLFLSWIMWPMLIAYGIYSSLF